jgi:hypothetical protein
MEDKKKVIFEKLVQAKRLEWEALMMLIPDSARPHLEVIQKETRELVFDLALSFLSKKKADSQPECEESETGGQKDSKVKKVQID